MTTTLWPLIASAVIAGASLSGCGKQSPDALIASAKQYLSQGDQKAASIQLKNALQTNPDLPEARFLLGKALLEAEDPVSANVELGKASRLKYPDDAVVPLAAKALLLQGETKKLVDDYASVTLSAPEAVASLKTSLATAYLARRDRPHADESLRAAFQAVPDYAPALILRARLLASERDMAGAQATLDKVLQKAPEDADAWSLKGDLFLYADRNSAPAIDAYKRALAARKNSLPIHAQIISAYLSRNDLKSAKEQLDALKKLSPNHPQTKYFEAQLAFQQGDFKTARDVVQQLLKVGSENSKVLQLAGAVAYQKGSLLEAEQFLGKAVSISPELAYARRLLAQTFARSGQPDKALATLKPMLDAPEPDAQTLSMAAGAYLQSGDAKKAEELYARAIKLDPKDTRSRTALALTQLYADNSSTAFGELESIADSDSGTNADMALISANLRRKDFAGALKAVDRLETKQPGKPLAPYLRGRVLLAKGDFAAARQSFERASSIDPVYYAAIESLAALDLRDKKPEAAEQRFDKLLAAQPENARALMAIAQLRAQAGKSKEEVTGLLAKAVKASPSEPAPRLLLINYYLQQKDFKVALAAAQDGIAALPNSPELLEALGRSQLATGDFNQAITSFNKLVAARPKAPQAYVGLADAYVAAGKKDDALASLVQALKISPGFLPAQQKSIALQLDAGRSSDALAIARAVQKQLPTKAVGWVFEGDIQALAKNWSGAAALYRTALQKEAATGIAEKLYAGLVAGGKRAEAEAHAAQWTKAHPEDAAFILYLGSRALAENKTAEADAHFQQLVKLQPDSAVALNNLAWTSAKLNKPGALELAERANKLKPDQPAFMDTLAMILAENKELRRAIEVQQKAVALQPQNGAFRLSLARMYVDAGDKALARKELDQLALLGSKFPRQDEVEKLKARL